MSVQHPKVSNKAKVIGEFEGFVIYGLLNEAKRSGKNRIWIQIRQKNRKLYRVSESLSYARSVDIEFVSTDGEDTSPQ